MTQRWKIACFSLREEAGATDGAAVDTDGKRSLPDENKRAGASGAAVGDATADTAAVPGDDGGSSPQRDVPPDERVTETPVVSEAPVTMERPQKQTFGIEESTDARLVQYDNVFLTAEQEQHTKTLRIFGKPMAYGSSGTLTQVAESRDQLAQYAGVPAAPLVSCRSHHWAWTGGLGHGPLVIAACGLSSCRRCRCVPPCG